MASGMESPDESTLKAQQEARAILRETFLKAMQELNGECTA